MKKLTLVIAVLAFFSISLFSFSKASVTVTAKSPLQSYVWIKYNCGSWGSAQVSTFSTGTNAQNSSGSGFPTWTNPHFVNCVVSGATICAIRFSPGEFEPIPGLNGQLRPKATVNPWDGNHMVAYCN